MDASLTPTPQQPQPATQRPQQPAGQQPPQNQNPPATGTWLRLDARDPEAEAAEKAYLQESARVRRGVWIGNFVAGFVVAAVLTGLGYVIVPRLGKPAGAIAAEVVGTDEQRREAVSLLARLQGQLTLWKMQHYDRFPDFKQYPDWEQFVSASDVRGTPIGAGTLSGGAVCGPYVQGKPVNPINGRSNVSVSDMETVPGDVVPGGPAGFVFSNVSRKFFVTDVAGTKVIDPAATPEAEAAAAASPAANPQQQQQAKEVTLAATLQMLRAQLELYRLQHNDALPDFNLYPGWDQLLKKTNADGEIASDGKFGPYMDKAPKNPLTGTARVQVVTRTPGPTFKAVSETVGYVLDTKAAKIWAVDAEGQLVMK